MKTLLKLLLYLFWVCVCGVFYSNLDAMHSLLKKLQKDVDSINKEVTSDYGFSVSHNALTRTFDIVKLKQGVVRKENT